MTVDHEFEGDGPVAGGSVLPVKVAGRGGVDPDAGAVVLNVTALNAAGPGHVTVFPCGETRPEASSVNYSPGGVFPNAVVSKVGANGTVCFYTHATIDLIVDVNGAFP